MARVKGGLGAKKRHNRTLKLAKGYAWKELRIPLLTCKVLLCLFLAPNPPLTLAISYILLNKS